MENVRGQPRGDGSWIAAVCVPSLLDNAFFHSPYGGHVSAITSNSGGLRSTNDLGLDPGGSILGWRSHHRHFVDALLPFIPRWSLDSPWRLLSPRYISRQRHPSRRVQFTGVGNLRVPAILYATFRVFLQAIYIRTAATLAARWSRRSSLPVVRRAGPFLKFRRMYGENSVLWSEVFSYTKQN